MAAVMVFLSSSIALPRSTTPRRSVSMIGRNNATSVAVMAEVSQTKRRKGLFFEIIGLVSDGHGGHQNRGVVGVVGKHRCDERRDELIAVTGADHDDIRHAAGIETVGDQIAVAVELRRNTFGIVKRVSRRDDGFRSEEHTSELQ